ARNRRRAAGRRAHLTLRTVAATPSGEAAPSPQATAIRDEQREGVLAAVNELREEDRLVIACRYFLELSEEETAAALGWRRGTVKSRLSRALDSLREQLGEGNAGARARTAPARRAGRVPADAGPRVEGAAAARGGAA